MRVTNAMTVMGATIATTATGIAVIRGGAMATVLIIDRPITCGIMTITTAPAMRRTVVRAARACTAVTITTRARWSNIITTTPRL
ncbi:hypothetical protein DV096_04775 [Bradymonadaceae bacterium TMQ3]|nr:hypothetical protein DV096_04775 [Bradymonadaceae bacterium TMQ3]